MSGDRLCLALEHYRDIFVDSTKTYNERVRTVLQGAYEIGLALWKRDKSRAVFYTEPYWDGKPPKPPKNLRHILRHICAFVTQAKSPNGSKRVSKYAKALAALAKFEIPPEQAAATIVANGGIEKTGAAATLVQPGEHSSVREETIASSKMKDKVSLFGKERHRTFRATSDEMLSIEATYDVGGPDTSPSITVLRVSKKTATSVAVTNRPSVTVSKTVATPSGQITIVSKSRSA